MYLSKQFYQIFEGKKAAIFDIDGTLVDSLQNWGRVVDLFAEAHKIDLTAKTFYEHIGRDTLLAAARKVVDVYGLYMSGEQMMEELGNLYFEHLFKSTDYFPGARYFLLALKAYRIPYAAATAGNIQNYRVFSEEVKPDFYISAESLYVTKPNPEVFFVAMRGLQVRPEECVIFEDSIEGLRAARSSGATVVCYLSSQLDIATKTELADFVIKDWSQFLQ